MRGGNNFKPTRRRESAPGVRKRGYDIVPPLSTEKAADATVGGLPPEYGQLYADLVEDLRNRGLKHFDSHLLRSFCVQLWIAERAEAEIVADGLTIESAYGLKPHPSLRTLRDANTQAVKLGEQFGLTLASRLRLGLAGISSGSALADLQRQLEAIR